MSKVVNKPMNSDMSQQIIDSAAEEDGGTMTGQEEEEDEDLDARTDSPANGRRGTGAMALISIN